MPRVVEVELNPVTKKLVVRMEDGFGREGIESLGVMNRDQVVAIDTGLLKKESPTGAHHRVVMVVTAGLG